MIDRTCYAHTHKHTRSNTLQTSFPNTFNLGVVSVNLMLYLQAARDRQSGEGQGQRKQSTRHEAQDWTGLVLHKRLSSVLYFMVEVVLEGSRPSRQFVLFNKRGWCTYLILWVFHYKDLTSHNLTSSYGHRFCLWTHFTLELRRLILELQTLRRKHNIRASDSSFAKRQPSK